jgi:uncharacterized integral membrane protein
MADAAKVRLTVAVLLLVLVVIFLLQNMTVATIRFLFWELTLSRALLYLLLFSAGMIGGWLLATYLQRHRRVLNRPTKYQ